MFYGIGATQCAYVKRLTDSDWDSSGACHGAYGNDNPRVGAIRFEGIHDSVSWADQEISQIVMSLRFLKAGSKASKMISFYKAAKSIISGTGQGMIGAYMGSITVPNAYNSVQYLTLSPDQNQTLFNGICAALSDNVTETFIVFADETPDNLTWSENYCKIDAAILNLTYEPRGSRAAVSPEAVQAGQNVSLSIEPLEAEGVVTHRVWWSIGDVASDVTELAAGQTFVSYTIPLSWCSEISGTSATAYCTLQTLVNGSVSAERDIPFTVEIPDAYAPSFTISVAPHLTSGGYYQHIGGAQISAENVQTHYGATVVSCEITGSEDFHASASSAATEIFAQSGTHVYSIAITDSRGMTATRSASIDVEAVYPVSASGFLVERYRTQIGDDGQPDYVAAADGDHVWVSFRATADLAGGNNTPHAYILYTLEGANQQQVSIAWESGPTLNKDSDRSVVTAQIPVDESVEFELVIEDDFSEARLFADAIAASAVPLHIAGNGHGVGIGMYASGDMNSPALDVGWLARMRGGIEGVTVYSELEQPTGGTWVDGRPVYRRTYLTSFSQSDAFVPLGTLPEDCEQVVRAFGMLYTGTQALLIPNAFYQSLDYMATPLFDGANISLALGPSFGTNAKSCALTVEYVKAQAT